MSSELSLHLLTRGTISTPGPMASTSSFNRNRSHINPRRTPPRGHHSAPKLGGRLHPQTIGHAQRAT